MRTVPSLIQDLQDRSLRDRTSRLAGVTGQLSLRKEHGKPQWRVSPQAIAFHKQMCSQAGIVAAKKGPTKQIVDKSPLHALNIPHVGDPSYIHPPEFFVGVLSPPKKNPIGLSNLWLQAPLADQEDGPPAAILVLFCSGLNIEHPRLEVCTVEPDTFKHISIHIYTYI